MSVRESQSIQIRRQKQAALREETLFLQMLTNAQFKYAPQFHSFSFIYGVEPIIVMELMGTDLGSLVQNPKVSKVSNESIFVAARDMLSALNEMHALGFCVRDVKLENFCAIRTDDNSMVRVKLVDFGMVVDYSWTQLRDYNFSFEALKAGSNICGTLSFISRAGDLNTFAALYDDLGSFFYPLMRLFGENVSWHNFGYYENYRQKVNIWTDQTTTLVHSFLNLCFRLIHVARRFSLFAYKTVVSELQEAIRAFAQLNSNSMSSRGCSLSNHLGFPG
ncbi:Protein kinase domain-containing protein [Aphelenchoides besseyi]|nr:Protein kinase domain-containing protein [Aphelenchoides besseyi]KAI6198430.1 Protein kinase domain-containing protein [Aphelenchoides besseyi]